jgi:hypothetical protein
MNVVERATQKLGENSAKTNFMLAWSLTTVKELRDRFHQNFVMALRAHPLL